MKSKLVLLHGFTGSPESWAAVERFLAPEFEVVAPALLGHSRSAPDPAIKNFDDAVDRLTQIVGESSTPTWLCGYSMGGRLALRMLIRRAHLFAGGILIGASPGLRTPEEQAARRAEDAQWCSILREQGMQSFLESWRKRPIWKSQQALPPALLDEQEKTRAAHSAEGLATALEVLGLGAMPSFWDSLRDLRRPLLWINGAEDVKFCEIARQACALHPLSQHRTLSTVGHNPLLEAPEALARWIQSSLQESEHAPH